MDKSSNYNYDAIDVRLKKKNLLSVFFSSPFLATNFRLDNAQTVFPCMDEPPYKATFKLSVQHPKNMTARSNTPLESSIET